MSNRASFFETWFRFSYSRHFFRVVKCKAFERSFALDTLCID